MCMGPLEPLMVEEKKHQQPLKKISNAKMTNIIEVWGDGEQTRSFLYIDDCIDGMLEVFNKLRKFKYRK